MKIQAESKTLLIYERELFGIYYKFILNMVYGIGLT